jgi:HD-like signal output (HDOD) protein/GGDEF domain-containing protein
VPGWDANAGTEWGREAFSCSDAHWLADELTQGVIEVSEKLLAQVLREDAVPSIPAFACKVIELCGREDASLQEVVLLIQNDAACSARLLRLANSPLFGIGRSVDTLQQAVSVLGLSTVRMITVATALVSGLQNYSRGLDLRRLWMGALVCSMAARRLAEGHPGVSTDEAFVGGLLQDLGIYQLHAALKGRYETLQANATADDGDLARRERDELGLTHAQVSAALLKEWSFPTSLIQGIENHEEINEPAPGGAAELAVILHVAEGYRRVFEAPHRRRVAELLRRSRVLLGVDEQVTVENLSFIERTAYDVAQALEVQVDRAALQRARLQATETLMHLMLGLQSSPPVESEVRRSLAVLRLSVDRLPSLEERLGARLAEELLQAAHCTIQQLVREHDLVLRWQDRGLLVLAPDCSPALGETLGRSLLDELRRRSLHTAEGEFDVTLSIGLAAHPQASGPTLSKLLAAAEKQRALAEQRGGDRVETVQDRMAPLV